MTNEADTALYGRVTYEMMDSYWPNAGSEPNASKHDITHSQWYNSVTKIVISNTLQHHHKPDIGVIHDRIPEQISKLKEKTGKNIQVFGSPGAAHTLMSYQLIDEYWLFINPILLGEGIPLFKNIGQKTELKVLETKFFSSGVVGMHYEVNRNG